MITRASYQDKRYKLLKSLIDVERSVGLEIGGCDLPTVRPEKGNCHYADFRSADEMAEMWKIPRNTLCDIEYIIMRDKYLGDIIKDKFDYIVACHVLEHVPDPINYINQLKSLLSSGVGRLIFLTIPEKRETFDRARASTNIDHILMDYHDGAVTPSFEHVLEFHRHWAGGGQNLVSIEDGFLYSKEYIKSGQADVHCHVWTDEEFFNMCQELIIYGFFPGLSIVNFQPTPPGFNEFTVVFST